MSCVENLNFANATDVVLLSAFFFHITIMSLSNLG